MRRTLALLGALFGFGIGLHSGCHEGCADAESHCCADSHCHCADPEGHNCQVVASDWECTVTWVDADGVELGSESYLYQNFAATSAAEGTCNSLQDASSDDAPDGADSASCSCTRLDEPDELAAPT